MDEYEDLPGESSQQDPFPGSHQTSSSNQGHRYLASVIDPRLYSDLYSADDLTRKDANIDDISGGSSVDQSSDMEESSW
jgi:hypothetical protein